MEIAIKKLWMPLMILFLFGCSSSDEESIPPEPTPTPNPPAEVKNEVDFWLTTGDKKELLAKQNQVIAFQSKVNTFNTIEVNSQRLYQTIDGFGFTLTGGSAKAINSLSTSQKNELLNELFGFKENSISISYLRVSIGASDLNESPFTYNDIADGQTDESLNAFSLEKDINGVIALLQEIKAINPNINILGSPWSAPVWMKDNKSFIGGSLLPQYYSVYAQYFVRYIQEMKKLGIAIDAVTVQNEPLHDGNNPSMYMTATEQTDFIKNHLGPAFAAAGLQTKIIAWDHNCDRPEYPMAILNDEEAYKYTDGSAFHLYAGDISALIKVHNAFPNKNIYFTEQYTASNGSFDGDLKWHLKNVIIGSMRNWSKNALEWNLANDENFQPHTDGGCNVCKGGLTINPSGNITRNVGYYIVAHASKFVPEGSQRVESNISGPLVNVAFKIPNGKTVLIVLNEGNTDTQFNVKQGSKWFTTSLQAGAVGTFLWD
ncbi:glycoside hydrolase family 30 protein [Galbibacter mesophilus]|uniref:glycoside hydrolase family 30 protein n=1 Tax=Galbibacter mesophilus TaxID=379069 RepID=UPI00191F69E1|nr:glycoside hydrolase family 30 beta sandwich domain-containing protein [Galbibacter mesophilus]MCM5664023.1 glucosylceramidase [Galbibacter mesophilus]